MSLRRALYTLAAHLLLPWAFLHLLWRSRLQPEYRAHWAERLGLYPNRGKGLCIWIHAVSVGETRAAQTLVQQLLTAYPNHRILLTHMTPTGRKTSEDLFGDQAGRVDRVYLPYDLPWAVAGFLARFRPALGLIMETELWPNLLAACAAQSVPVLLVNARLSERSARRYHLLAGLTREALGRLAAVAAQTPADAARLTALGAPAVQVLGNVKFDLTPPAAQLEVAGRFRQGFGGRLVFLWASTREGEEARLLEAWEQPTLAQAARQDPPAASPLLVVVPRHPQRFDEVAQLFRSRGLRVQQRSSGEPLAADTQVWLGDSMGEMYAYYAAADVALVGGSVLPFGSQNLIEPCAVGTPVLLGPSTFNFAEAAREAVAVGAARSCADAGQIVSLGLQLLADGESRQRMGAAGKAFAAAHRGATERTMALVARFLGKP